jgi:hypothetical protein
VLLSGWIVATASCYQGQKPNDAYQIRCRRCLVMGGMFESGSLFPHAVAYSSNQLPHLLKAPLRQHHVLVYSRPDVAHDEAPACASIIHCGGRQIHCGCNRIGPPNCWTRHSPLSRSVGKRRWHPRWLIIDVGQGCLSGAGRCAAGRSYDGDDFVDRAHQALLSATERSPCYCSPRTMPPTGCPRSGCSGCKPSTGCVGRSSMGNELGMGR